MYIISISFIFQKRNTGRNKNKKKWKWKWSFSVSLNLGPHVQSFLELLDTYINIKKLNKKLTVI